MKRYFITACAGFVALAGAAVADIASAAPLAATTGVAAGTTASDMTAVNWNGHRDGWRGGHRHGGYGGFYGPRFYGPAIGFYSHGPRCWWSHRFHRRVCRY